MKCHNAFSALICGAVIGAAAALLFAPDNGKATRKKIKKMINEEQDRVMGMIDTVGDKIKTKVGKVKSDIDGIENCM